MRFPDLPRFRSLRVLIRYRAVRPGADVFRSGMAATARLIIGCAGERWRRLLRDGGILTGPITMMEPPGTPISDPLLEPHRDHSRLFQHNRFVYPVLSRRSRGISVGINLNPDKVCNFDCVYCQVDRSTPPEIREVETERVLHRTGGDARPGAIGSGSTTTTASPRCPDRFAGSTTSRSRGMESRPRARSFPRSCTTSPRSSEGVSSTR